MSRYIVCAINWGQLEPVHPGHTSREDAERVVKELREKENLRAVAITTEVWDAYEKQLYEQAVEDGEDFGD